MIGALHKHTEELLPRFQFLSEVSCPNLSYGVLLADVG